MPLEPIKRPAGSQSSIWLSTSCLLLCLLHADAQSVGDSAARLAPCNDTSPPDSYHDTAFLGKWHSIFAADNNITYKRLGPLGSTASAEARPLVMIAGSGATSSVWTPDLLRGLAQGREVITFDNPGVGYSTLVDANYTVPNVAAAIVEFIYALDIGQPDVLGFSLGGVYALQAEIDFPGTFSRLILVSTYTGGSTYLHSPAEQAAAVEMAKLGTSSIPPTFVYPDTPEGNRRMCDFVASQSLMPHDPASPEQVADQAKYGAGYKQPEYTGISDHVSSITIPTLILVGLQDIILAPANSQLLLDSIPNARLLTYADAAHNAIMQHDRELPVLFSAFLDAATVTNAAA